MISTLIGIQSVCIGISTYLLYKSNKKPLKMKKIKSENGFKYYKIGGF